MLDQLSPSLLAFQSPRVIRHTATHGVGFLQGIPNLVTSLLILEVSLRLVPMIGEEGSRMWERR